MSEREPHWWHTNRVPNILIRKQLSQIKWFILFLARALGAHNEWPYPEFKFTATNFMSMAAKSSDLAYKTSAANLQVDGQMEMPTQGAKDLWEPEEEDSSPSHLPLWSPAQRPPSSHPNVRYCLEIQVTFNRRIGGCTPTLSFLDGPTDRRHVARSKNWTYQSSADRPR